MATATFFFMRQFNTWVCHWWQHTTGDNMSLVTTCHWWQHVTGDNMSLVTTCHWWQHVTGDNMSLVTTCLWWQQWEKQEKFLLTKHCQVGDFAFVCKSILILASHGQKWFKIHFIEIEMLGEYGTCLYNWWQQLTSLESQIETALPGDLAFVSKSILILASRGQFTFLFILRCPTICHLCTTFMTAVGKSRKVSIETWAALTKSLTDLKFDASKSAVPNPTPGRLW